MSRDKRHIIQSTSKSLTGSTATILIHEGRLDPNALVTKYIPELADSAYGDVTVRQVLDMLVNEGLIFRQRGRGSFVAHPTVEQALVRIISFTDDMLQRGFAPSTRVLSSDLVPAPRDIAERLEVEEGEELARMKRLRIADGEPMSVEESFLVHRLCPGVLGGDYAVNPLREALLRDYGIRWSHARQVIRAILATRDLARTLSMEPESALLFIERVSYSQDNVPVEFLRIYYRADRYSLYSELQG